MSDGKLLMKPSVDAHIRAAAAQCTAYDDPRVDDAVAADLALLVADITAAVPVRAIVLGGGFGRGEGSVLVDGGRVRPVNDYDLILAVPDGFATDLRPLGKTLAARTGIRLIDLIPLPWSAWATLPPTQFNYDLKYGGRRLWGEDALAMIPAYPAGTVAPGSIRTLLLNRLICALEAFTAEFARRAPTPEEAFFLVNQTGKVISACVEARLMQAGNYHHSYRRRQAIMAQEFPEERELLRLNERATAFKLRPTATVAGDPVQYWRDAVAVYGAICADLLLPRACELRSPAALWAAAQAPDAVPVLANNQIEQLELLLLLCSSAPPAEQPAMLAVARLVFGRLAPLPAATADWETLRAATVRLWHERCH